MRALRQRRRGHVQRFAHDPRPHGAPAQAPSGDARGFAGFRAGASFTVRRCVGTGSPRGDEASGENERSPGAGRRRDGEARPLSDRRARPRDMGAARMSEPAHREAECAGESRAAPPSLRSYARGHSRQGSSRRTHAGGLRPGGADLRSIRQFAPNARRRPAPMRSGPSLHSAVRAERTPEAVARAERPFAPFTMPPPPRASTAASPPRAPRVRRRRCRCRRRGRRAGARRRSA